MEDPAMESCDERAMLHALDVLFCHVHVLLPWVPKTTFAINMWMIRMIQYEVRFSSFAAHR
jgi:hypothetical protein